MRPFCNTRVLASLAYLGATMKNFAAICGVLALAACAGQQPMTSKNPDLPGIPTTINCNPEPELIYSKTGDLIETKYPVLHPSCEAGAVAGVATRSDQSLLDRMMAAIKPGPALYAPLSRLEADTDPVIPEIRTALSGDTGSGEDAAPTSGSSSKDDTSGDATSGSNDGSGGNTTETGNSSDDTAGETNDGETTGTESGESGSTGESGDTGSESGESGSTGESGNSGSESGESGSNGESGDAGSESSESGSNGESGDAGSESGESGSTGESGNSGSEGVSTCESGESGESGENTSSKLDQLKAHVGLPNPKAD